MGGGELDGTGLSWSHASTYFLPICRQKTITGKNNTPNSRQRFDQISPIDGEGAKKTILGR